MRRLLFLFLLLCSTAQAITYSPNGTSGLNLVYNGNDDDNSYKVNLPWSVSFLGTNYNSVYVGTNGYITFQSGSSTYSGFSASNPGGPHISIYPGDRRLYKLYYAQIDAGTAQARFVIRAEGVDYSNGAVTHIWEVVFYPGTSYFDIYFVDAPSSGNAGTTGISNGSTYVSTFTTTELTGIRINADGTINVGAPTSTTTVGVSTGITTAQQTRKNNLITDRNSISGNQIYIDQAGSNNTIDITQSSGNNSIQGITQQRALLKGDNNTVIIKQGNSLDTTGKNLIKLEMNTGSNSNQIKLYQGYNADGTMNASDSNGHIISLSLLGSTNQINLYQTNLGGVNAGNFAEMNVTGNTNNITVNQKGGGGKTFFSTVTGNANTISAAQDGIGQDYLNINLTGNGHTVNANQNGSGSHLGYIDLTNGGGSSTVNLNQTGSTAQSYSIIQNCLNPAGCSVSVTQQ